MSDCVLVEGAESVIQYIHRAYCRLGWVAERDGTLLLCVVELGWWSQWPVNGSEQLYRIAMQYLSAALLLAAPYQVQRDIEIRGNTLDHYCATNEASVAKTPINQAVFLVVMSRSKSSSWSQFQKPHGYPITLIDTVHVVILT